MDTRAGLAACLAMALGVAGASSTTSVMQISLKLVVSCRVNSATVRDRAFASASRGTGVACAATAPHALYTSMELPDAAQDAARPLPLVTLVF